MISTLALCPRRLLKQAADAKLARLHPLTEHPPDSLRTLRGIPTRTNKESNDT